MFDSLATRWDEAVPLGNATVGALVWRNGDRLRMSLDRTDLWDLRASDSLSGPNYSFEWVKEHIRRGDYSPVQKKMDLPYDIEAAPSKIPGAALEFDIAALGKPRSVRLSLADAACEVIWPSGVRLVTFVHAGAPVGWYEFTNLPDSVLPAPVIVAPVYSVPNDSRGTDQSGAALGRLGYEQGTIERLDDGVE
ncbi:MAG: glycoside hydrolase family 95 protein, partial [Paramuribaculum sp.]|nr:glycoside hydrolase family 95 protein [Paramuribaculum sp.]